MICEKLEGPSVGAKTFRDDRDIQGGDSIPEAIMQAIRDCSEVAVLVTPQSVERKWVIAEIGMASVLKKRIVPLLYHTSADDLLDLIRQNRAYHLNELELYLSDVASRMREQ